MVSWKCGPEVKQGLGVGVGFRIAFDIANFEGDIKLFLCVAYWMYLIHIQLGFLGLRDNSRKESMNLIGSLMCPCCCCYWRTASETSALDGVVQPKRLCLAAYPISAARKACGLVKMWPRGETRTRCRSGIQNRIRHSQFWGWHKVVPVCGVLNVSNSYSTGIPWSKR